RSRIRQRAGIGGRALHSGERNRNRKESQIQRPAAAIARAHVHGSSSRRWPVKPLGFSAAALAALTVLCAQAPVPDPIFKAMHDEIDRSTKLTLANLEAPYFVEYVIAEEEVFTAGATLGGLVSRRRDRFRIPDVHVRVGDYKFDNSNYVGSGLNFGSRYDLERFPLEDSYPLLRRY